jgi:putative ABC transport system permease protein
MEIRPILSALLRSKTGAVLVAVQVAISLAILTNALHIVNVRQAVSARPSGIANEGEMFYVQVRHLAKSDHNEQLALQKAELQTVQSVSGVVSAAFTNQMPMTNNGSNNSVSADRKQVNESASSSFYFSPDDLVKTMGLKVIEGRNLLPAEVTEIDNDTAPDDLFPPTVLVTKKLAEKVWPGAATVIGKTLYFGTGEKANGAQVVGVVETLQSVGSEVSDRGEHSTILPMRLTNGFGTIFVARAEPGQRDRVMKEVEAALLKAAPRPVILRTRTVAEDRVNRYRADTALSWMLITVSVLLLLITASGIVGMASLWVTQRRKQIGVRRALGARRIDILRYFLTENFMITSVGVASGLLLGIGLNQLLVSKLEMAKLPIPYLLGGAAVFWALGLLAVYGPAWRAATISPATATRSA